jgi:hypothetical protein
MPYNADDPQVRDTQIMKDQDEWPYSCLPLIRRSDHSTGFLVANGEPVLYYGNMRDPNLHGKPLADIPHRRYGDFGSIVRDGWRVD